MVKIVIAGSRNITDEIFVKNCLYTVFDKDELVQNEKTVIISGEADGVDTIAKQIAKENNFNYKPYDPYNADETYTEYSYNQYLNKSFYLRNEEMAEEGDVLIAIWDGESNGTKNMIDIMLKKQKQTHVFIYNEKLITLIYKLLSMHTLKLKYKTNFKEDTINYIDNLEHEIYNDLIYFNESIINTNIYISNPYGKEYIKITIEFTSEKDIRSSQFIKSIDDYMNKKFETESLYKTHDIEIIKE